MSTNNFLKEIREVKENFKIYAEKALSNNWLTAEEHAEILQKIENDKLTIGVIGQMKCGKSTFLNALIFKDEILPAATTPMTASLSVITYGEQKKLEAEFYTLQEWEELKHFASLNEADYENDTHQKAKIKASKELVDKSDKILGEIDRLLGSKKADAFENLIEYVGADGKYIAITKSVRIEYPMEDLKGVEIVDTPGFNDPVVSREERTKDFLKNADVVVMLLYAGRAFDATDKDIIFNKVRSVGVGKILIGINKYDINYMQGDTEQEIINNVKEQLLKASEEHYNSSISQLIKEQEPLLLSANMALMSKMELSKVTNGGLKYYYEKALSDFEISTQKEMYEKSLMPKFEEAIRDIIFKSKDEILIRKPINYIKQKGANALDEVVTKLTTITNKIKVLETPDEDLEDKLRNIQKAKKKILNKIENFKYDINSDIRKDIQNTIYKLEDLVKENKKKCKSFIDKSNYFSTNKMNHDIENVFEDLRIDFNRSIDRFNETINLSYKNSVGNLLSEISNIMDRFIDDFESDDYQKRIDNKIEEIDVVKLKLDDFLPEKSNSNGDDTGFIEAFVTGAIAGVLSPIIIGIDVLSYKDDTRASVDTFFSYFNFSKIKPLAEDGANKLTSEIEKDFITEFINPIESEFEEAIKNKEGKEQELIASKTEVEKLKSEKQILEKQTKEMENLVPHL